MTYKEQEMLSMEIVRKGNKIEWKRVSRPLEQGDRYIYSPADKTVFILHHTQNSIIVTGYNHKGVSTGSYEYKNSRASRLFIRAGFANMVYCFTEDSGNKCWYQAKLLCNGYCTELYALHRTDGEGRVLDFTDVPVEDILADA